MQFMYLTDKLHCQSMLHKHTLKATYFAQMGNKINTP